MSKVRFDRNNYKNTFNKDLDTDGIRVEYDDKFRRDNPDIPDEYRGHLKNYHTHTYRCNHATGDVPDYCQRAVELGFDTIGFTEHNPFPKNSYLSDMRMKIEELPDYISDINQARTDFPELTIFSGLECDYRKRYDSFYKDYLLGEMGLDYLTGSVHVYPYNNEIRGVHGEVMNKEMRKAYTQSMIDIIESGIFIFVNHPDLFGQQLDRWTKEAEDMSRYIIQAAKENHIPLELNTSGIVKTFLHPDEVDRLNYPIVQFWEIVADEGCEVVINSDAHNPKRLDTNLWYGMKLSEKLGLKLWKGFIKAN